MKFSTLCVSALAILSSAPQSNAEDAFCTADCSPPFVNPKLMIHGEITTKIDADDKSTMAVVDIRGCCTETLSDDNNEGGTSTLARPIIGKLAQMSKEQTLSVLGDAEKAWDGGSGAWPQMTLRERIDAMERLMQDLETNQREKMVQVLMWEIGKNRKDAESEFDRTISFAREVMQALKNDDEFGGSWESVGSTMAFVRRAAIGIVL
ncbi:unnamed protein product [Pseudo-nitzschia multistriata]|uniref:Aldehyde dehydrogenase domain-containing protein n=1 Tax=Pseudo-nitzschia multistriata TaxID=183589 RepID=A0A448ZJY4_9STRA|nr:unnamed protein product [Pseudo-nitzschia multistriata]